jgi:hypothetical protein
MSRECLCRRFWLPRHVSLPPLQESKIKNTANFSCSYQVFAGLGVGVGFQGGILVVQTVLPMADVAIATACVSFFQQLGGAIFIAVCQSLFQNGLVNGLQKYAPQLDAQLFLHAGATDIRPLLAATNQTDALDSVLQSYVDGLTHTYWVTTACAIAAFFAASGLEWKSVKQGGGAEVKNEEGGDMEMYQRQ